MFSPRIEIARIQPGGNHEVARVAEKARRAVNRISQSAIFAHHLEKPRAHVLAQDRDCPYPARRKSPDRPRRRKSSACCKSNKPVRDLRAPPGKAASSCSRPGSRLPVSSPAEITRSPASPKKLGVL